MHFYGQLLYNSVHLYPLMCYLQVEFPFLSENERSSRGTLCGLSETGTGLSETSNRLSENSPLLSERVINKRTRTVKTRGSLKLFSRPLHDFLYLKKIAC
jgi:hypothetical protein